jgi:hypothetical protein
MRGCDERKREQKRETGEDEEEKNEHLDRVCAG